MTLVAIFRHGLIVNCTEGWSGDEGELKGGNQGERGEGVAGTGITIQGPRGRWEIYIKG